MIFLYKYLKGFIFTIPLFLRFTFFSTFAIFSLEYKSSDNVSLLLIVSAFILIVNLIYYFYSFKFSLFYKNERYILFGFFFLSVFYLITIISFGFFYYPSYQAFLLFLILGLSSFFGVMNLHKHKLILIFPNVLSLFFYYFTLSIVFSQIGPALSEIPFSTFGGETYQTISYLSGILFSYYLFSLVFNKDFSLKPFLISFPNLIKIILLVFFIFMTFYSGGRGGLLLIIFCLILFFVLIFKKTKKKFVIILSSFSFLIFFTISFQFIVSIDFLTERIQRFILIFTNLENSSNGRFDIYLDTIILILKSPIIGYGLTSSYYFRGTYPHNFILEILLEGGIIYLIIWITIFIKMIKAIKFNFINLFPPAFLVPLSLYLFIIFNFTSSYLRIESFWFFLFFLLISNKVSTKHYAI
jgi:O-antigen ligase